MICELWILALIAIWINLTHESAIPSYSSNFEKTSKNATKELLSAHHSITLTSNNDVAHTADLPPIPQNITNINELLSKTTQSYRSYSMKKHKSPHIKLTPTKKERLKLAQITDTNLSCFIAPPNNTIVDMDTLMGFWYMIRTVSVAQGKSERYTCEQAVYTKTGPNTFDEVADVHFRHKWIRIQGNGTFIKPGTIIIDWNVVSSKPTKINRLVYTVLGTDYHHYVIGYNCHPGHEKPEIVLQARNERVPMKYLNQAYAIIKDDDLTFNDMDCHVGFRKSRAAKLIGKQKTSQIQLKSSLQGRTKASSPIQHHSKSQPHSTRNVQTSSPPQSHSSSSLLPSAVSNLSSTSTTQPLPIFNQMPPTVEALPSQPKPSHPVSSTFSILPSISLSYLLSSLSMLSKSNNLTLTQLPLLSPPKSLHSPDALLSKTQPAPKSLSQQPLPSIPPQPSLAPQLSQQQTFLS